MSATRRRLYGAARLLGDIEALAKGPAPYARRLARKAVYRRTGGLTARVLRGLGL